MNVTLTLWALLVSGFSFAQEKKPLPPPGIEAYKCIYSKRYSDKARLQLYPFNDYQTIKLVSYRYHGDNLPIRKSQVIEDSLIEEVTLSKQDIIALTDVLYNNYTKGGLPPLKPLCSFAPRNAILFFDDKNSLREFLVICFHCSDYEKSSDQLNTGSDCTEKLEKLRKLFIEKGVKFGTDKNIERYPGETGICCD
ncbi:MAG TPA: hypothetical protein VMR70_12370 [Flavisolibacter sp.]|nr:hypothetical protein [Flavisolibacter sp.]